MVNNMYNSHKGIMTLIIMNMKCSWKAKQSTQEDNGKGNIYEGQRTK